MSELAQDCWPKQHSRPMRAEPRQTSTNESGELCLGAPAVSRPSGVLRGHRDGDDLPAVFERERDDVRPRHLAGRHGQQRLLVRQHQGPRHQGRLGAGAGEVAPAGKLADFNTPDMTIL